jgi:hypothetical protein
VSSAVSSAVKGYLDSANERLRLGRTTVGARMARTALIHPACARDTHVRATALVVLAQACILESRFRLARSLSSRARSLFAHHSDPDGQADACALLSYSASALGHAVEAADAARHGIELRAHSDSPVVQAFGLNYSGIASFWSRDYGTSRAVLDMSVWCLASRSRRAESFQPLVNLAFCELLQLVDPEPNGKASQDYSTLITALASATQLQEDGCAGFLNRTTGDVGLLLVEFARCFLAIRLGLHDEADKRYLECLLRLSHLPRASWLHALLWWARLERERATGRFSQALASASAMHRTAAAGAHVPLAAIACALEQQLWAAVGPLERGDPAARTRGHPIG